MVVGEGLASSLIGLLHERARRRLVLMRPPLIRESLELSVSVSSSFLSPLCGCVNMRWVLEEESFCFLILSLNIFDNYDLFVFF